MRITATDTITDIVYVNALCRRLPANESSVLVDDVDHSSVDKLECDEYDGMLAGPSSTWTYLSYTLSKGSICYR